MFIQILLILFIKFVSLQNQLIHIYSPEGNKSEPFCNSYCYQNEKEKNGFCTFQNYQNTYIEKLREINYEPGSCSCKKMT
jgi:hypothetical protein